MKKILSVLLTVAMLITLLPAMGVFAYVYDGRQVVFEAEDVYCNAGDTITVALEYKSGFNVMQCVAFDVKYDPGYLTFVSGSVKTPLTDRWEITDSFLSNSEDGRKNICVIVDAANFDIDSLFEPNDKIVTMQFKVNDGVGYAQTEVDFSLNQDKYMYWNTDSEEDHDIGKNVSIKNSTVTIGTPPTPSVIVPEITNVVTKDSDMNKLVASDEAIYKVIPAVGSGYNVSNGVKYTSKEESQAAIDAADSALASKGFGEKASRGSNIWLSYPIAAANKVDNPCEIDPDNTISDIINGNAYLLKAQKGQNIKKSTDSAGKVTVSSQGVLGIDDEFVKFDINASGTMYVIDTNGRGYPGGEAVGFEKITGKIAGCNAYAKKFTVDTGKTLTVSVPSQGLSDDEILKAVGTGVRVTNTQGYIFLFDDEYSNEINGVKADIGGNAVSVNCESGKYEYTVSTVPYTGTVDLVFDKKASGQTITGDTSVNLAAGNGEANFTVKSANGLNSQDYKITFACTPYKLVATTKGYGAGWTSSIYGTATEQKTAYIAVDGLDVEKSYVYSDRTTTVKGSSANLAGATFIRTPKNEAAASYSNVEVFDESGKSGTDITFTKTIEGEAPVTLTGRVDGAFDDTDKAKTSSGFRIATTASADQPFFAGKYDGTAGAWWVTFVPTSDCTVIIGDKVGQTYPNLDKTLWKNNTNYAYAQGANHSYVRHFKAGETVQIPNYGLFAKIADKRKVTYEYHDSTGKLVTMETTVAADFKNWEDITFAIVWDDKAIDNNAAYINIDGAKIAGFKAETTSYTYEIPYGTDSVKLEAAAADSIAKIEGAEGTFKAGETATIKIIAGNGTEKVYTVVFTQGAAPVSKNAALSGITVNGKAVEAFAADKYSYDVTLPYGTTPDVKWTLADEKASAALTNEGNVYKITVTAEDGETKLEYVVNVKFEEKKSELKASAIGGGSILATYGAITDEDWGIVKTEGFETGAEITLKAVAGDGEEFLYWKDNQTSRVVSYYNEYSFVMGTAKDISAVFKTTESFSVKFMDMNYKVVGEGISTDAITVPKNPYLMGYTFGGWKIGDEVKSEYVAGYEIAANTFDKETVITAIQNTDATEYQVTFTDVKNYTSGTYKYNTGFTAEHVDAAAGKKFSHWVRDGKIVSYDDKYVFYVGNYDTAVSAIFVDEADAVVKEAKITMAEPTVVAGNKISFIMERSVPEGFSVIEAGILMKKDLQTSITLDTAGIIKGTSVNHASYGAYNLRKANVVTGETWSAVGYLIYKDADGNVKTIYSDVVSKTL